MSTLLNKTRMFNKILQKSGTDPVDFDDICTLMSGILISNVYIVSRKGKVIGSSVSSGYECDIMNQKVFKDMRFPESYNNKLLNITEAVSNLSNKSICVIDEVSECPAKDMMTTIVPIVGNRERLGTLVIAKHIDNFTDDDLILAEYGSIIIGLEILRSMHDEIEDEARKKAVVQLAIGTLSYSELEAVEHIFNELNGSEGLLVASKIADKVGITRSVIVNALRKFESAGVIESRSLGMKGTHIKILNDKLLDELKKIK